MRLDNIAGSDGTAISLYYDPYQRLVSRHWPAPRGDDALYYDGPDVVLELRYPSAGGSQWVRYVHGPGADQPLATEVYPLGAAPAPGTGSQYYYHADGEGSIRLLTDANGQIANRYDYDSYGQRLTVIESLPLQPYGWKGREWIPGPNIYYNRARFYDPVLGRFMSQDPLGYEGGDWNLYSFAWNNPKNWFDPTGNSGVDYAGIAATNILTGAAFGAVGAGIGCAFSEIGATLEAATLPGSVVSIQQGACTVGAVVKGAALGAITAPFAAVATARVLNSLPPQIKGAIGEQLSYIWNTLGGAKLVGSQTTTGIAGLTARPDWIFYDASGLLYYVESKFGLSSLTKAQREALAALGPITFRVERSGYEFFSGVGAGLAGISTGYFTEK